jgi:hypothetical protein
MNSGGTAIEAAGPLFISEPARSAHHRRYTRFPHVAVDEAGTIRLVYLTRGSGQCAWDLMAIRLELDPASGRPRLWPGDEPRLLARDFAAVPPVLTADGRKVFGISQESGVIAGYSLRAGARTADVVAFAGK